MLTNPDFFARCRPLQTCLLAGLVAAALLAGCGTRRGSAPAADTAAKAAPSPAAPASAPASAARPGAPALPANAAGLPSADALTAVLAYADRVRTLPPAELGPEAAKLGEASAPADQLRLALLLGQGKQLPDVVRAQELLTRLLGNTSAEAQAFHPLARLLAGRLGEQRRLEEQLEKQTQQSRDLQRRLDQTTERLEALKAIERSLPSRPPAGPAPRPR